MENKNIIEQLGKPLDVIDIELKIQTINEYNFSLIAYKTARADIKRLNSVCGLGWKKSTKRDEAGNLETFVSIYNKELDTWITRSDIGTPSMTEKAKGEYSDSLKRTCFQFNIGLELYTFPIIKINADLWNSLNNGKGFWINKKTGKPNANNLDKLILSDYVVENQVVESFKLFLENNGGRQLVFEYKNRKLLAVAEEKAQKQEIEKTDNFIQSSADEKFKAYMSKLTEEQRVKVAKQLIELKEDIDSNKKLKEMKSFTDLQILSKLQKYNFSKEETIKAFLESKNQ
jgi:hypothetical protein